MKTLEQMQTSGAWITDLSLQRYPVLRQQGLERGVTIRVPNRAFLYESSGRSSSSKFVESVGRVHCQEETSQWQFNSANEQLAI